MKYQRKACAVDAFRFSQSAEVNSPAWFIHAVQRDEISIDRCIRDGAARVYGCTIQTPFGRMRAKNGDYIVREQSGMMMPYKEKDFKKMYERMQENGG